jgi:SAM-dependent methyltransferase
MVETQQHSWNKVAGEISFSLEPDLNKLANLITKDAKILDYGCGYGRIAHELYVRGYRSLTGVDTSIEMVLRGLKQYPELNLQHVGNYEIPIELGKFDVILFCAVLTCIPIKEHRTKIIESVYKALNEGGIIYCVEFHKSATINYSPSGTYTTVFRSRNIVPKSSNRCIRR